MTATLRGGVLNEALVFVDDHKLTLSILIDSNNCTTLVAAVATLINAPIFGAVIV